MNEKKHTVYIATVGSSIEPIQRGIRFAAPDIAYLLFGPSPKLRERNPELVAKKVKKNAKTFGLTRCHLREIDAFSLESVMTEFIGIWQKHMNDRIIANITGGTNIMASACLLAGFTASAEVIYVKELQEGENNYIKWKCSNIEGSEGISNPYQIKITANQSPQLNILQPDENAYTGVHPLIQAAVSDEGWGIDPNSINIVLSEYHGSNIITVTGSQHPEIYNPNKGLISYLS